MASHDYQTYSETCYHCGMNPYADPGFDYYHCPGPLTKAQIQSLNDAASRKKWPANRKYRVEQCERLLKQAAEMIKEIHELDEKYGFDEKSEKSD